MGGAIESTPPRKAAQSAKATSDIDSKVDSSKDTKLKIAPFPRQRSRGQLARRNSITRGNEGFKDKKRSEKRRQAALKGARHATSPLPFRDGSKEEKPLIGALFFTDIVFIAFTYLFNLLRTCGLAELADVAFKGLIYATTQLPSELYRRWTLSTPPAIVLSKRADRKLQRRRKRKSTKVQLGGSSSESEASEMQHQPIAFTSSYEPEPTPTLSGSPDQLSPFHHLVILLVRFACSNFPHLVPRVLFAEETIGPFVYWRTGGGSNAMVQEFSDLQERQLPVLQMGGKPHRGLAAERPLEQQTFIEPKFRAYLISKDARLPLEVQRTNLASRSATTLFYLHGGGFSLGSVAFYAEALLRLRAKICALEAADGNQDHVAEARCVAVEYDLSPAARFPTPLLQCLRCYAHLIEVERIEPSSICIAGDSAGGNLAMGLLLCLDGQMKGEKVLAERDWSKLPMPGKAVLISPWVDLRPQHAHSFCDLRGEKDVKSSRKEERREISDEGKKMQEWTEAVAAFDWDYVASEALLHFAQVYTGVLPSPRRVRGPVGWFAHVCSVLARDYNAETGKGKAGLQSYPLGPLSSVIGPSKRVAQATHDLLSDPFLFSVLGLKDVDFLSEAEESQAVSTSISDPTSSFAPLFTSSDRKTDTVPSKKQLYEPIVQKEGKETSLRKDDNARREAQELLDTHPLISPATGDWRRIKLKGGCLVTWGERERMAEDIESWVQAVHRDIESEKNAPPAQDGESYQPRPSRISFDEEGEEEDDCWIETAVERGPGGVHAWPFVSMYLAGTEPERQRGLDLLADFIARSPMEQSSSSAAEHASVTASLEEDRDVPTTMVDPPHAAPDSPISETGSVGSMPSDVDLHGLVDEEDEDRFFQGPGPVIDIGEAARLAHEIRSRDTSVDDLSHGLGLSNDADSMKSSSSSSSSKKAVKISPKKMSKPVVKIDLHHSPQQHQVKHAPAKAKLVGSQSRQTASTAARHIVEKERGRSRSPRRTANLTASSSIASSASSSGSATSSTENLPHFISSVRLHRPAAMQAQLVHEAVELPRGRQGATQTVAPLWWTSTADKTDQEMPSAGEARATDTSERQEQNLSSEGRKGKERQQAEVDSTPEDILDDNAAVMSPNESLSPPSQDEETVEEVRTREAMTIAPIDISFYGLSPYAIRRPEPEGLSDIAEEGSVMSGSITSAGDGNGFASRSLSPEDRNTRIDRDSPRQTSLTAASLLLKDQSHPLDAIKPRWPIEEEDESPPIVGAMTEEEQRLALEYKMRQVGQGTFQPSDQVQPEASIPLNIPIKDNVSAGKATTSSSSSGLAQSDASTIEDTPRKKPKGDVWW